MKRSIRQLCQNLRDNPNIAENMAKVGTVRHSILVLFNNALNDLRSGQNVQSMIDALKEHQKTEVCLLSKDAFILPSDANQRNHGSRKTDF